MSYKDYIYSRCFVNPRATNKYSQVLPPILRWLNLFGGHCDRLKRLVVRITRPARNKYRQSASRISLVPVCRVKGPRKVEVCTQVGRVLTIHFMLENTLIVRVMFVGRFQAHLFIRLYSVESSHVDHNLWRMVLMLH